VQHRARDLRQQSDDGENKVEARAFTPTPRERR